MSERRQGGKCGEKGEVGLVEGRREEEMEVGRKKGEGVEGRKEQE